MAEEVGGPEPDRKGGTGLPGWWSRLSTFGRATVLGLTALVVVGTVVANLLHEPSAAEQQQEQQELAHEACKRFVAAQLKAPTTAKWGDPTYRSQGADSFAVLVVSASVDAQNGFGALIRSNYTCTVRDLGDEWELVDLKIR